MTNLINKFLNAQSNQEINNIVSENLEFLNANPRLFSFARNARRRIARIKREMKKSFKIYEMN